MYYRWQEQTLFLECSIQTRAGEDRIVGKAGNFLRVRLNAAPADGKANKHLIKFLAGAFKVKQNAVTIVIGHTSRQKKLRIHNPAIIPDILQEVIQQD